MSRIRTIAIFLTLWAFAAGLFASAALAETLGELAEREMRTLALEFPGRMAGTEQELAAAQHLLQRLESFGLAAKLQPFPVRFTHVPSGGAEVVEFEGVSHNVVANIPGRSDEIIIIGAHFDTAVSRNPEQAAAGIGGPKLQGLDDNASGVGVLLELASRLAGATPEHAIRLIFFGAEEVGLQGARHVVAALSPEQRAQLRLMINIDSIITGDNLYVHAGPVSVAADPAHAWARDRMLNLAAELGIELKTNPGLNPDYPAGTGCCSDQVAFDEAGIPVANFEATNWRLGNLDGYQQTEISEAFPAGETWHNSYLDRIEHLEAHLPPGRLSERAKQVLQILLPFVQETAG